MRQATFIAGLFCLFLGWNAPNHYPPWAAFHLEMFAGLGLCFLALATAWPQPRGQALPAPQRAVYAWALVACLPWVQFASGQLDFKADAWIGMLYGLGVAAALVTGQWWAWRQGRDRALRSLWLTLLWAAIVAAALGLAQAAGLTVPSWLAMELIDDRPFANFAQPNHLGLAMVWGIVCAMGLFESRVFTSRLSLYLAVLFLLAGLAASQSRGALLAFAAVVGLWLASSWKRPTRLRWFDALAALVAAAVLWRVAAEVSAWMNAGLPDPARGLAEVGPRSAIWQHFWAAALASPWVGHGFNQAVSAMGSVAASVAPSRNVVFAHNLVLDLITWFGFPLAVLLLAALGRWMAGWLKRRDDAPWEQASRAVLALWLALLVQSLLEFPYAHAYFLLPAALAAGMVALPAVQAPASRPVRVATLTLMAGLAVLFLATTWEYFRVETDFRFNRFDRANFSTKVEHEVLPSAWVLDHLVALNQSAKIRVRRGMPAHEIDELHRLARRFHMVGGRLDYARALALNGRSADAEDEMQRLHSVLPAARGAQTRAAWQAWRACVEAAGDHALQDRCQLGVNAAVIDSVPLPPKKGIEK